MKKLITAGTLLTLILTGCATPKPPAEVVNKDHWLNMAKIDDTTYKITATLQPIYATNKHLTWDLGWAPDSSSTTDDDAFKAGKTATDYVSIALNTDTTEATIKLLQAFGSQISVTAKVTDKPSVTAGLKIDYQKRLNYTTNSGYKYIPATTNQFVNPITFTDSIGTLNHNKVVTYEYSNKFYWHGGSQTTAVEWTDEIIATRGEGSNIQSINLLNAIGVNIASRNTASFNFEAQTYIFSYQHASSKALDDLAYAVTSGNSYQAQMYRNKGARINIGYRVFVDGEKISGNHPGITWTLAPIDFTGYEVQATSITLTDTTIIF